jgi:hypothetical protein
LVKKYGKYSVSTDGGHLMSLNMQIPQTQTHIHSPFKKSIIERAIGYVKDRTEALIDYYSYLKNIICRM